jgi:WD40 repeat protein
MFPNFRTRRSGQARIWDVASGRPIGPPLEQPSAVTQVAFHPDGKTVLVTAEGGRQVHLWSLPDPVEGGPEQVTLWVRELTGQALGEDGAVRETRR